MKHAQYHDTPSPCGINPNDFVLYRLSQVSKNEINDNPFAIGAENEAGLILSIGDGIFDYNSRDFQNMYGM